MSPQGSRYDPAEVAGLAHGRRIVATLRVANWLIDHGYDAADTLCDVLGALGERGRWIGSCDLQNGAVADEYVVGLEEDWCVKFWVDGVNEVVNVWSCCWDGSVH